MDELDKAAEASLRHLADCCSALGVELCDALHEKADELVVRAFLRCLPNEHIKESRIPGFLIEVLGREPEHELLGRVRSQRRGPELDDEAYLELLRDQRYRCALCGVLLVSGVRPQVDHIIPVALGGKNDRTNYQLLCQQCNIGKSKIVGWIMGAPFFREGLGYRLRYCVLTRYRGQCCDAGCGASARNAEMEVVPIIPPHRGGRMIFDNLRVLCCDHAEGLRRYWKHVAIARLGYKRASGNWSPA